MVISLNFFVIYIDLSMICQGSFFFFFFLVENELILQSKAEGTKGKPAKQLTFK